MIIDVSPQVQELGEGGHTQPDWMGKQHGNRETGTRGEQHHHCQRPHLVQDHHMKESITIAIAFDGILFRTTTNYRLPQQHTNHQIRQITHYDKWQHFTMARCQHLAAWWKRTVSRRTTPFSRWTHYRISGRWAKGENSHQNFCFGQNWSPKLDSSQQNVEKNMFYISLKGCKGFLNLEKWGLLNTPLLYCWGQPNPIFRCKT